MTTLFSSWQNFGSICAGRGNFQITAGNSQGGYVRDILNRGVIPEGMDLHCLAGLNNLKNLERTLINYKTKRFILQIGSGLGLFAFRMSNFFYYYIRILLFAFAF